VKRAHRFEALEPIRQALREQFGTVAQGVAAGITLRHDHGSVYLSNDFQQEITFFGLQSSPSFVRQPQGNGCIEAFFRTLKEQLLWIRSFADMVDLRQALSEFRTKYNHGWIIGRLGYRTPAQARADFFLELGKVA
jgi:putative transposase